MAEKYEENSLKIKVSFCSTLENEFLPRKYLFRGWRARISLTNEQLWQSGTNLPKNFLYLSLILSPLSIQFHFCICQRGAICSHALYESKPDINWESYIDESLSKWYITSLNLNLLQNDNVETKTKTLSVMKYVLLCLILQY